MVKATDMGRSLAEPVLGFPPGSRPTDEEVLLAADHADATRGDPGCGLCWSWTGDGWRCSCGFELPPAG